MHGPIHIRSLTYVTVNVNNVSAIPEQSYFKLIYISAVQLLVAQFTSGFTILQVIKVLSKFYLFTNWCTSELS